MTLSLVSQFLYLLASLLPLKIIILLSYSQAQDFSFVLIGHITQKEYISILSVATIFIYLLYTIIEKYLLSFYKEGSPTLLKNRKKEEIEPRHLRASQSLYTLIHKILSGLFIIFFSLIFINIYYLNLGLFLTGVLITILFMGLKKYCTYFQNTHDKDILIQKTSETLNFLIFILSFGFIIINYLFFNIPSFFVTLISLLLSRHIANEFSKLFRGIYKLLKQKKKIISLIKYDF